MQTSFINHLSIQFNKIFPFLPGAGQPALREKRKSQFEQACKQGLPSVKHPLWKYARLDNLLQTEFAMTHESLAFDPLALEPYIDYTQGLCLVFINGHYIAKLSNKLNNVSVTMQLFSKLSKLQPDLFNDFILSSHDSASFFSKINSSFCQEGMLLLIPENKIIIEPIIIYQFLLNEKDNAMMIHPQNHIHLGKNSQATVIEKMISLGKKSNWMNSQTQIKCEANSKLALYRFTSHQPATFGFHHLYATQLLQSELSVTDISFGGDYQRHEMLYELSGKHATLKLFGLQLPNTYQHSDWVSKIHHIAPLAQSLQKMKSIVANEGHSSFIGNIVVNQSAQETATLMMSDNLLLGEKGQADSSPQLEIHADDVKCNHASTIGQLEESVLFYLQSKGISYQEAQKILLNAFLQEIIDAFPASIKETCLSLINKRLDKMMQDGK